MITETVEYVNLNGEEDSRVLHFHISEATLMDNIDMRDRLQYLVDMLAGPKRILTSDENQQVLNTVKWFISISYGIKSMDGNEFDQDDPAGSGEIWRRFKNSSAYNTFIMGLFQEPEKLLKFIANVLPESIRGSLNDNQEYQEALKELREARDRENRLPPGTRIVNDVPVYPPVADESHPDFDEMLREASNGEEIPDKTPISQQEYDFMHERLKSRPEQFEKFMSTRFVKTAEG